MRLSRLYRKTFNKPLGVYWWRYDYPNKLNFGDEITPMLIEKIFGIPVKWESPDNCELIGAGSIIEVATELSNGKKINVWGSGFIKIGEDNTASNLNFCAVRGKSSLSRIGTKTAALGDPGLLAPLALPSINPRNKHYKLGVVAHYADADSPFLEPLMKNQNSILIDPLWPVEKVLHTIASCELVLSSSLHGLIISDSFKVPNYWMPFSNKLTGGDYKFNDYYSVFNEKANPLDASMIKNLDLNNLIEQYQPKENLESVQQSLVRAFPY